MTVSAAGAPVVAYLGPPGTYSQGAVLTRFGADVQTLDLPTIDEVFAAVDAGRADYGVVPVENSTEGAVNTTLDCLVETGLQIVGEVVVPIEHHLLMREDADPTAIRGILSHKQSLAQCRHWLARHRPGVPVQECLSNADAARRAAADPGFAAIAGARAAEVYGLRIAARAIQDQADNSTRFLVLARQGMPASGHDKTSTLMYTANRPGALFRLLEPFARHCVSLTRLESRPSRKAVWDYVFFIDFEGHVEDPEVRQVLATLRHGLAEVKVLGSYPVTVESGTKAPVP